MLTTTESLYGAIRFFKPSIFGSLDKAITSSEFPNLAQSKKPIFNEPINVRGVKNNIEVDCSMWWKIERALASKSVDA